MPRAVVDDDDVEEATAYPALILAGFWLEELAGVRSLLDQVGAQMIRVVPSNPQRLHQSLRMSLGAPEHAWEEAIPDEAQNGGGWGADRILLASGLTVEGISEISALLAGAGIGPIVAAAAEDYSLDETLGVVLAETVQAHRRATASGGGNQQEFVESLPDLEDVLAALEREEEEEAATAAGPGDGVEGLGLEDLTLIDDIVAGALEQADAALGSDARVRGVTVSAAQMRRATEEHGLDFEKLKRDAQTKGIQLSE